MQVRSSSLSYRIVSALRSCSSRDPSVGASWIVLPNLGWGVRGAALSEPCPCSVLMGVGGSAFSGEAALLSFGAASFGRPGPPSSGAGSTDAERPIRRQRCGSASLRVTSCALRRAELAALGALFDTPFTATSYTRRGGQTGVLYGILLIRVKISEQLPSAIGSGRVPGAKGTPPSLFARSP